MSTESDQTPEKSEAEQAFDAYAEMVMAPAGDQPPPEPPPAAADAPQAPDSQPAQPDAQQPDLAAQLAAERAEKERLQHQLASDRGRLLALQREKDEQRKAAEAAPAEQDDDEDELARLAEEYPEIAAPLQRTIQKIEQRLGRVLTSQERAETAEAERLDLQNTAEVERSEPGGIAFIRQNAEAFAAWVKSPDITVGLREKAERNASRLVDPAEAKDVIAAFKRHMGATSAPTPTPTTDRRQRQLAGASTPRGGAPARVAADVEPTDPEKAFAYYAKIAEREMGLSG
jgi:chromosome segregation ATPase